MVTVSRKGKPNKIQIDYTLKDIYKYYKKDIGPEKVYKYFPSKKITLDYALWKSVVTRYWELILERILLHSETYKFPFHLGTLRIRKRKMNLTALHKYQNFKIDFKHWRETGKRKFHMNEKRDFYQYEWVWRAGKLTNGRLYYCVVLRKHKRKLANLLLNNNHIDYFE